MKFSDDGDDNDVLADGETLRTRIFLTDRVVLADDRPHFVRHEAARDARAADIDVRDYQPGYRHATDAARAAVSDARDEMIQRATTAWRTPQRGGDMRSRDAAEVDLGAPPEAMRRHHALEFRGEQAQRERDRAWSRYRDGLANAWKADPRAAGAIERRAESERRRFGRG